MSTQGFNAQNIPFSLEVANTTYTEKEILLPITRGGLMPAILQIDIEIDQKVTAKYFKWHLSISSETSIKATDNQNVIESDYEEDLIGAAAGSTPKLWKKRIILPAPVIVTREKIYFGAYQDTGNTMNIKGKIWYVPRSAPGLVQRQNLVNQTQY